jgi:hypothetical protein
MNSWWPPTHTLTPVTLDNSFRSCCTALVRPALGESDSSRSISRSKERLRLRFSSCRRACSSRSSMRICTRSFSHPRAFLFKGIGILYPRLTRGPEQVAHTTAFTVPSSRRTDVRQSKHTRLRLLIPAPRCLTASVHHRRSGLQQAPSGATRVSSPRAHPTNSSARRPRVFHSSGGVTHHQTRHPAKSDPAIVTSMVVPSRPLGGLFGIGEMTRASIDAWNFFARSTSTSTSRRLIVGSSAWESQRRTVGVSNFFMSASESHLEHARM